MLLPKTMTHGLCTTWTSEIHSNYKTSQVRTLLPVLHIRTWDSSSQCHLTRVRLNGRDFTALSHRSGTTLHQSLNLTHHWQRWMALQTHDMRAKTHWRVPVSNCRMLLAFHSSTRSLSFLMISQKMGLKSLKILWWIIDNKRPDREMILNLSSHQAVVHSLLYLAWFQQCEHHICQ